MFREFQDDPLGADNLTHFGLAYSNRINLPIVGLCSLVEIFLYEIAKQENENPDSIKLETYPGQGYTKYVEYLKKQKNRFLLR